MLETAEAKRPRRRVSLQNGDGGGGTFGAAALKCSDGAFTNPSWKEKNLFVWGL